MIDKLTEQLSSKEQNVVLEPLTPREELIERIKNNFVYIKFVNTNGTGTEVGVDLIASNIKELKHNNIKTLIIEVNKRTIAERERLIAERDNLLNSGMYLENDPIIVELNKQIRTSR